MQDKEITNLKIIGRLAQVSFPEFEAIGKVNAKIDTGAFTGALHCTKINLSKNASGSVLSFSPFDHPEIVMKTTKFRTRLVKSSNGTTEKRYFISTVIKIAKETYPITLSLADRSEMRWPVLIGRRFLRRNNFLVDVKQHNS